MTDEKPESSSGSEWTVEAVLGILRRQATGLKAIRDWLHREPAAKPADDSAQRMEAILQLKAIRQYADEIASDLEQETAINESQDTDH